MTCRRAAALLALALPLVCARNASTDNGGVAGYDVFRNGVQIAAPAGKSYTHRPPRGTFTYQVRARDAAGNVSGLSAGVTVTT